MALAPSLTEILFELELGDRVVGVGDYCSWPPEATRLPRLGGLFDVRLERIVELDPDLAVLLPSEGDLADQMEDLGVEVLTVANETFGDVVDSIEKIAARCGVEAEGLDLVERLQQGLAPRATENRPSVVVTIGRQAGLSSTILVAGPGTFIDELLHRAGGENAFAGAAMRYPQVGPESILASAPEVIIDLYGEPVSESEVEALLADWSRLGDLPAVTTGCVSVVAGTHTLLAGPRLPLLYADLTKALDRCRET